MKHFKEFSTALEGLKVIERTPLTDERGLFARLWCARDLKAFGWQEPICQINYSVTKKIGAVRGMHFQKAPYAEMKFITCLRGEVFDVVVDLRKNSPSFLKFHGEILSAKKNNSLLIPKGFAHGFQVLSADAELLYFHSAPYSAAHESGILVDDPILGLKWPLAISERSERDKNHALISKNWEGLEL